MDILLVLYIFKTKWYVQSPKQERLLVPFDMIDDSASSTSGPPKEDGATSKSSSSHLNYLYHTLEQ